MIDSPAFAQIVKSFKELSDNGKGLLKVDPH